MKYKIYFTSEFKTDLDKTFNYICNNLSSPLAAKKLMEQIDKSIFFVADNPYMYPLCPDRLSHFGLRKIAVKNYIVIYFVNEENKSVNFLNLFYGRRNYIDFFER